MRPLNRLVKYMTALLFILVVLCGVIVLAGEAHRKLQAGEDFFVEPDMSVLCISEGQIVFKYTGPGRYRIFDSSLRVQPKGAEVLWVMNATCLVTRVASQ